MKTVLALFAMYDGLPIVPVQKVCEDFFDGLSVEQFLRKTQSGEISLPVARMYDSQKAAKGVHINDLATFIDRQVEAARKELAQVNGDVYGRSQST